MRLQYLALSLFAASRVTAAAVPVDLPAATGKRDVPYGCTQDYVGNTYGCGSVFPGQNYCQQVGVAGDYPCLLSIVNHVTEMSAVQLRGSHFGKVLYRVQ
ncbi:hypothetical protein LY76DRAFT_524349 [Colletotrichum caudatum]|nr:hypothetical protein LY76DRAFT_524349 [Colletotrichum caudatum]